MKTCLLALAAITFTQAASACALPYADADRAFQWRSPFERPADAPSSLFGMRKHPILGYEKLHTGVDWNAATGTPVRAVAAGRVNQKMIAINRAVCATARRYRPRAPWA